MTLKEYAEELRNYIIPDDDISKKEEELRKEYPPELLIKNSAKTRKLLTTSACSLITSLLIYLYSITLGINDTHGEYYIFIAMTLLFTGCMSLLFYAQSLSNYRSEDQIKEHIRYARTNQFWRNLDEPKKLLVVEDIINSPSGISIYTISDNHNFSIELTREITDNLFNKKLINIDNNGLIKER